MINTLIDIPYHYEEQELEFGETGGKAMQLSYDGAQLPSRLEELDVNKKGLTKLKIKHRKIIAAHLSGLSVSDICNSMQLSPSMVHNTIRDPLAQRLIADFSAMHEEEFKRLAILANQTLRESMQPYKKDSVRLKAASVFFNRMKETGEDNRETAEDVMGKILNVINAENVQVNIGVKS